MQKLLEGWGRPLQKWDWMKTRCRWVSFLLPHLSWTEVDGGGHAGI